MLSRLAPRTGATTARLGAATASSYVRWCATKAKASVPVTEESLDPIDSIARARSLVSPSEAFPATKGTITGPADPRIYWREHWDSATSAPYYENVATHLVTLAIPEAFPTRYGAYYVGKGFNVVNDLVQPKGGASHSHSSASTTTSSTSSTTKTQMRQFSTSRSLRGVQAAPEGTDPSKMTMKQRIASYGTAGLVLYLIIHNTLLFIIFVMLYFFEIDLVTVARSYGYELKFLPGGKTTPAEESEAKEIAEEVANDPSLIATFITAVALCKMVVPVQLTITLALCPVVAPKLNVIIQRWRMRTGRAGPMTVTPPV